MPDLPTAAKNWNSWTLSFSNNVFEAAIVEAALIISQFSAAAGFNCKQSLATLKARVAAQKSFSVTKGKISFKISDTDPANWLLYLESMALSVSKVFKWRVL